MWGSEHRDREIVGMRKVHSVHCTYINIYMHAHTNIRTLDLEIASCSTVLCTRVRVCMSVQTYPSISILNTYVLYIRLHVRTANRARVST